MVLLIQYTLLFASVLLLVALGGCFSEHSGVINLGLEGIMVMGALGGALMMRYLPDGTPAALMVLLVILTSIIAGMLYSCLLAISAIHCNADQTIVGTAMNILGTAAATVIVKAINTAANPDDVSSTIQYVSAKKAFLVNIGSFEFNWFMLVAVIALVLSYITLYKTKFGLRLMACGEHPQAADSVGINVCRMRYIGTTVSGALAGLGGYIYIATVANGTASGAVAGMGFLALAIMIFGNWKPLGIAFGALLFGFLKCLGVIYDQIFLTIGGEKVYFLKDLNMPMYFYNIIPYIAVLVVLAFTSKKSRAPKAEGIPYDKGAR